MSDGRVCDVLAVSRALGDWEFKGKGLATLLREGVTYQWWDQEFADGVEFKSDPVIPQPAVNVTQISEAQKDEFLVVATDGLWCAAGLFQALASAPCVAYACAMPCVSARPACRASANAHACASGVRRRKRKAALAWASCRASGMMRVNVRS